ncbi:MAG: hypothetical protein ACR2P1_05485 [Pseudomonadales bacterium]
MNWQLVAVRVVMLIIFVGNFMLIYPFWVNHDVAVSMYGGTTYDPLHTITGGILGAAIASFSVAALLVVWRPIQHRSLILLLFVFHVFVTVVDVVLLNQQIGSERTLQSQTYYDTVITVLLLICYWSGRRFETSILRS